MSDTREVYALAVIFLDNCLYISRKMSSFELDAFESRGQTCDRVHLKELRTLLIRLIIKSGGITIIVSHNLT